MKTNTEESKNNPKVIYEIFDSAWRRVLRDPYTGWTITLVFAAAIAMSLAAIGYFTCSGVSAKLAAPGKLPVDTGIVLDENELRVTLEAMVDMAVEHASLSKTYSGPGDPSR